MERGNKRGSHVGVIASFGIFMLFLIGLYVVLEPSLKFGRENQNTFENLKTQVFEKLSSNLTIAIISVPLGNCTTLPDPETEVQGVYSIVKDQNNNIIDSEYSGNVLQIQDTTESVLWVYYSETEFESSSISCSEFDSATVESVRNSEQFFEKKIVNAVDDFENFKNQIDISGEKNFAIGFEFSNGTKINTGQKNVTANIYVEEIPVQYVNEKAEVLSGELTLRVW